MWNVMTDEIIAGYWENEEGKTVAREYTTEFHYGAVYVGQPWAVNPSVEYVLYHYGDESPVGLGYIDSDGLTSEVVYTIMDEEPSADFINDHLNNNGSFLVTFRGWGDVDGWYANYEGWHGYPEYTEYVISDLAELENGTNYFYCISMATWNGKFNYTSDCFAETLTAMEGGSIGVLAPTGALYGYWDDLYTWGFVANMFPDFDPDYHYNNAVPFEGITTKCPGFALFSGIDYMMSGGAWMYTGSQTNAYYNAQMLSYLGDPFSFMYTEEPQELSVTHLDFIPYNSTSTLVTADAGSFIAITLGNSILGTAVGTGSSVDVPLDYSSLSPLYVRPSRVLLTITKPNYYRYTDYIYLGCYTPESFELYTAGYPSAEGIVIEDYNNDSHPDLGLVFLDSNNNTYVEKYSNEDIEESYTFTYDDQLRYDQGLQAYTATTCKTRPSAGTRDMVVGYQDRIAFINMTNGNTSWFTGYNDEVKSFSSGYIDGDSYEDLAVGFDGNYVKYYLDNNGSDGLNSTAYTVSTGNIVTKAEVASMKSLKQTADHYQALIIATQNKINLYVNTEGSGGTYYRANNYSQQITVDASVYVKDFTMADIDLDGRNDLAVLFGSTLKIYRGATDTTFQTTVYYTYTSPNETLEKVTTGDFNYDGYPDLALISKNPSTNKCNVNVFLNEVTTFNTDYWSCYSGVTSVNTIFFGDVEGLGGNSIILCGSDSANEGKLLVLRYQGDPEPSVPLYLTATLNGSNNPILAWNSNMEADIDGYLIYRAAVPYDSSWNPQFTNIAEVNSSTTTYTDSTVEIHPQGNPDYVFYYCISAIDMADNESTCSDTVSGSGNYIQGENDSYATLPAVPVDFALNAFPNPFNNQLTLKLSLPEACNTKIILYNIAGQVVAKLQDGYIQQGYHLITFDAKSLSSGIYFCHTNAGKHDNIQKVVLMR